MRLMPRQVFSALLKSTVGALAPLEDALLASGKQINSDHRRHRKSDENIITDQA
jgi:hypothetical protein